MFRFNHYKTALYLCAALAVTNALWILLFVIPRTPQATKGFIEILIVTVITIVGLLLKSNLIRYFGAILMAAGALGLFRVYFTLAAHPLPDQHRQI